MDTGLGRIPPHSLEAEQSVLGAMLLDKEAINTAIETIRPDDFYKEADKALYLAKNSGRNCYSFYHYENVDGTPLQD